VHFVAVVQGSDCKIRKPTAQLKERAKMKKLGAKAHLISPYNSFSAHVSVRLNHVKHCKKKLYSCSKLIYMAVDRLLERDRQGLNLQKLLVMHWSIVSVAWQQLSWWYVMLIAAQSDTHTVVLKYHRWTLSQVKMAKNKQPLWKLQQAATIWSIPEFWITVVLLYMCIIIHIAVQCVLIAPQHSACFLM